MPIEKPWRRERHLQRDTGCPRRRRRRDADDQEADGQSQRAGFPGWPAEKIKDLATERGSTDGGKLPPKKKMKKNKNTQLSAFNALHYRNVVLSVRPGSFVRRLFFLPSPPSSSLFAFLLSVRSRSSSLVFLFPGQTLIHPPHPPTSRLVIAFSSIPFPSFLFLSPENRPSSLRFPLSLSLTAHRPRKNTQHSNTPGSHLLPQPASA